jgi:hypothetical protein
MKPESDFTKFLKNPSLKDRGGRVVMCKDCCSKMVEENGNTKEALKNVLRLVDIPYLENFADSALETYDKKRKNTNLIIKKNVYDENEEVQKVETTSHQNTIYTCYSSKLGLMPKKYINFTFSDGIRNEEDVEEEKVTDEDIEKKKAIQSSIRALVKQFSQEIFDDKKKLSKAVELNMQELSLHKNNTNKRQQKFKLKNNILTLIDGGILDKEDFLFLYDEEPQNVNKDLMVVDVEETKLEIPQGVDLEKLRDKWGSDYKPQDLVKFEKKYDSLKKNYEIKTASHEEFLKNACVATVRANECMAKNDMDASKGWMAIFKDMTSAGKLQPSQMSKADLSGGLNNFSEFYKTVEQSKNVIDILPEMYETPRDKADFVIFCLVQYVRRLKGLPDVEYKDIYKFYEEMESQFVDESDADIDFESFFDDGDEGEEDE